MQKCFLKYELDSNPLELNQAFLVQLGSRLEINRDKAKTLLVPNRFCLKTYRGKNDDQER